MSEVEQKWKHKARALLLPTPLADIDEAGEGSRKSAILNWLHVEDPKEELHKTAITDAQGVHVPLSSMPPLQRPRAQTDPDPEVPLRALVHPLSGERASEATDETRRLSQLVKEYEQWATRCIGVPAPTDSGSFAKLWYGLHTNANGLPRWMAQAPGHPRLRDHTWLAQRSMASALVGARFDGRDPCLLHVHCGPVQSFIAAARRTNDLWLGSYLVSLLSYQATRTIAELCGPDALIYPYLASLPLALRDQLSRESVDKPTRSDQQSWLRASQPNRFVALVDEGQLETIATQAADAVLRRWNDMTNKVREGLNIVLGSDKATQGLKGFDKQIGEHLEVDIVGQPWPADLQALHTMLAAAERSDLDELECVGEFYQHVFGLGRDTLGAQRRVISLVPTAGDERTKCSQCGRREAMGPRQGKRAAWEAWWGDLREGLRDCHAAKNGAKQERQPARETVEFRQGEALCAVCLTKRLASRYDLAGTNSEFGLKWCEKSDRVLLRFPSVASIAAAPLRLYLLEEAAHATVGRWLECLRGLELEFDPPGNLLPGLGEVGREKEVLNPDGTWLYTRSYERDTVLSDHDLVEHDLQAPAEFVAALEEARGAFAKIGTMLAAAAGLPKGSKIRATPYYAVLVIDVDEMGKWLDGTHPRRPLLHEVLSQSGISDVDLATVREKKTRRPISSSLHAEVSRRQGRMASTTLRDIVEHDHLGRVVYSGGDDVLAIVPLHTVWTCLRDIERAFTADAALGSRVGLSAGVAIYDWRAPLSLALQTARKAESKAKETRGCVVVDLEIRSGAPIELRLPWRLEGNSVGEDGDLSDLGTMVTELLSSSSDGSEDAPPLLRPSAAEVLRRELDTLRHIGLEAAFEERVFKLVRGSGRAKSWLEHMVAVEPSDASSDSDRRTKAAKLLNRKRGTEHQSQQLGQVVDFLLFVRFLAREQGGIDHQQLAEKIKRHRERRASETTR